MSGHIFISYRSSEADFTLRLAADLKNAGVRVWVDRLDGIQSGDEWLDSIDRALKNSSGLIAVLTPDYFESQYCRGEIGFAYREGRPVFPVVLRRLDGVDLPFWLPAIQQTDFSAWPDESGYREGLDRLMRAMRRDSAVQVDAPPDAEAQYLNRLIAELEGRKGVLEYVDLAGAMDEPARPKPRVADDWGLEGAFAVLETLTPQPPLPQGEGERGGAAATGGRTMPLESIRAAVAHYPRFVLIGEPGAGKTTTLRRLALDAAYARRKDSTAPLPVLVFLPAWGDEPLSAFVGRQLPEVAGRGEAPLRPYNPKQVALFLDGLNEMGAAGAAKAAELRGWLAGNDAPARVIVTCRAGDYGGDLDLKLPTVLAGEMDAARIRQFAANYLGEAAERFLARVTPAGTSTTERGLFRLAKNPYLLTALMVVYRSSPEGDLPRNNGALFRRLAMALWERERTRQTPGWLPFDQMEHALATLAFTMIDAERPIDVSVGWARKQMAAALPFASPQEKQSARLLSAAASASLLETRGDEVRFYHQLMQEYFAAVHLAQVGLEGRLETPNFTWSTGHTGGKWRQVIVALGGVVPDAGALVRQINQVNPYLAVDCLTTGLDVPEAVEQETVTALLNELHHEYNIVRVAAADALARLGEAAAPHLLKAMQSDDRYLRRDAARALGQIGDPAAVPLLINALADSDHMVRQAASGALGHAGAVAVPGLIGALSHSDKKVRSAAASLLGPIRDPAAVEPLIVTLADRDKDVRRESAYALCQIGDARALVPLLTALDDKDRAVRSAAAEGLGQIGDPAAVPALIARLTDTDQLRSGWRVCDMAAAALERIATPEALEAVKRWKAGG